MTSTEQSKYEKLLQTYAGPLRRLAWSCARNGTESDDLLQEIAMALWTALPGFRGDASERTWLYRVAHNTALSYVARQRRRAAHEQHDALPADPVASGASPEAEAIDRDRQRRMWAAIRELPVVDRQVIVLWLENMSASEIEAVTGFTAGSIATRLTRIRQRLTARLRGEEVRG
jgi:RNA polymerase sigma factor (sigma-70 family)